MRKLLTNPALWSLTLGHFACDLYSGAMPIVFFFLRTGLSLSLEQVGLVSALYSICSSVSQPIFGYIADRHGGRWLAAGGVFWMALFQGVIGYLGDFTTLLLVAPLAGFGAAAFHPPSASSANRASGDRKTAGVAIFMLGGNVGFAVGPLVAKAILDGFDVGSLISVSGWGLHGTAVMAIIGLVLSVVLAYVLGRYPVARPTMAQVNRKIALNPAFSRIAVFALLTAMTLRAWSQSSVSLYVPPFFTQPEYGLTVAEVSNLSFVIFACLAIGSLTGGFLSDRIGGRTVMVLSLLLTAPTMYAFFGVHTVNIYLSAALLGFATGASWPPMLVMGQELFPRNAGIASGLTLGFVFATGGLGNAVTGYVAERFGLTPSMLLLSVLPLVSAICTLFLPRQEAIVRGSQSMHAAVEPHATAVAEAGGR
ncbi:MAG: MFS transporter [Chloroflexi bacterium]|nr:MFS transporter [Chloroflexota bacterium]